jgi:hypothetical protein
MGRSCPGNVSGAKQSLDGMRSTVRIADIEKGNEDADQYVIARFENQFRQAQAEIAEFGAKQEGGWRSSAGRTVARPDSQ